MWIVPKTLSAFVQDTEGLMNLDCEEVAWMFESSVTWRSKFMSRHYWLKRWKKGGYVQHLFGRTLKPSMHSRFVDLWTASQVASRANHFQVPVKEEEKKIQDTCGQASQMQFEFVNQVGSSSKMSSGWLPLGCVTYCKTWDEWVTEQHSEYLVRKKSAPLINASGFTSWPTIRSQEPGRTTKGYGRGLAELVEGKKQIEKKWPTATTGDSVRTRSANYTTTSGRHSGTTLTDATVGPRDQDSPNINGSHREQLNPSWVETLMGLPIGWTDLGSWGTESSHKPQN